MIFEAGFEKGKNKKDPTKLKSKSFTEAHTAEAATHVKFKNSNNFELISDALVIKRIADEDGKTIEPERIRYTQINPNSKERYVCEVKDGASVKDVEIYNTLYTHIVLMRKSPEGTFYKCDDGKYVHKHEIQIPAYKKLEIEGKKVGLGHDGEFFVQQEVLKLKSTGEEIVLTKAIRENPRLVKRVGDKWFYLGNGTQEECEYCCNENTRYYVKYVLIDGKIIESKRLSYDSDGKVVVDVEGIEPIEGEKEVKLTSPFVDVATADYPDFEDKKEIIEEYVPAPPVLFKTGRATERTGGNRLINGQRIPESMYDSQSGYQISIQSNNKVVRFAHRTTGEIIIYALYGERVYNVEKGSKVYRVKSFTASHQKYTNTNMTKSGNYSRYEFSFEDPQLMNLEFLNTPEDLARTEPGPLKRTAHIDFYPAGDKKINNLKWEKVDGVDQIDSYEMNGVKFTDIVWEGGEIKSCKIEYKNDVGEIVEESTDNIKSSRFKNLAIKCNQIDSLEDVKVNDDGTISFKLGNYEFKDAVIDADGKIGKCKLKIGSGEFYNVDLATETRFEQLRLSINTILINQEIIPLVQTRLHEKKDGKYQLIADVVQTRPLFTREEFNALSLEEKAKYCNMTKEEFEELKKDRDALDKVVSQQLGISPAKELEDLEDAISEEKKFIQNPFKTVVFDSKDPSKIHILTNFENTYECASEFELDKSLIPNYIGKDKIEVKNGKIVIDPKRETDRMLNTAAMAFGLCTFLFPFGLVAALPLLPLAAVMAVASPIRRAIKKYRLEHLDIADVTKKIQENAEKLCRKNINKIERAYRKKLKSYKKLYSPAEYRDMAKTAREEFEFECQKEIGGLQILGEGAINCKFSLLGKTKITNDNFLGFVAANSQQRDLLNSAKCKATISRFRYLYLRTALIFSNKPLEKFNDEMRLNGLNEVDKKTYKKLIKDQSRDMTASQSINRKYKSQKSKKNIQEELDNYNNELAKRGEPAIDKSEFKRILKLKRDDDLSKFGSIGDKIRAYKRTPEYKNATLKERRALSAAKRKALKKSALVTAEQAVFSERFDKKGNSIARENEKDVLSYVGYVTSRLDTTEDVADNNQKYRRFKKGFHKEKYAPTIEESASIAEAACPVVYSDKERRCAYDAEIGQRVLNEVETSRQVVAQHVESLSAQIQGANYEQLCQLEELIKQEEAEVKKANIQVMHQIRDAKYRELNESKAQAKEEEVRQTIISTVKVKKLLKQYKAEQAEAYRQQVEQWSKIDYVREHKAEFETFCKGLNKRKNGKNRITDGRLAVEMFINSKRNQGVSSRQRVEVEMKTYRVQNDVEENIRAEVFCDQPAERANFEAWVETERRNGARFELDSERARCAYYAHCLRTRPLVEMDNFKRYSVDECSKKTQQRIEAGELVTSDKKQEQLETVISATSDSLEKIEKKSRKKDRNRSRDAGHTVPNPAPTVPNPSPVREEGMTR